MAKLGEWLNVQVRSKGLKLYVRSCERFADMAGLEIRKVICRYEVAQI
jgi:hypothetical protein